MVRILLAELMRLHVFAIKRNLKDRLYPIQTILEEITVLGDPDVIMFVSANGNRIRFNRYYVDVVKKTFKNAEWYLSAPMKKGKSIGLSLLIGILPNDHYLLLAPRTVKGGRMFDV